MTHEDPEYDLVMPFLPVNSRGGPYDDEAYVAGWEMGQVDAMLATIAAAGQVPGRAVMVHAANVEQVDLLAMRHRFVATHDADEESGWASVEFTTTEVDQ